MEQLCLPYDVMDQIQAEIETIEVAIASEHHRQLTAVEILDLIRAKSKSMDCGPDTETVKRRFKPRKEIVDWCVDNCQDYYTLERCRGIFVSADDAVRFKLVWG